MEKNLRPETLAAQAMGRIDGPTGAIIPPIHPSATYERAPDLSYPLGRLIPARITPPTTRRPIR